LKKEVGDETSDFNGLAGLWVAGSGGLRRRRHGDSPPSFNPNSGTEGRSIPDSSCALQAHPGAAPNSYSFAHTQNWLGRSCEVVGQGHQEHRDFHITSKEWRISWDTQPGEHGPGNFQIYVYTAKGTLDGIAANVIGANQDHSIMRGAGDYYLTINTGQPYTIIVEARP
jgi:hypothetical protein